MYILKFMCYNRITIKRLNVIASFDFEKAQAMLEGINLALGTEYAWLNKRVVFGDEEKHDAYIYAK